MTANTPDNNQAASGGIKSKLTDAQRAMLASKSGGGTPMAGKAPARATSQRTPSESRPRP